MRRKRRCLPTIRNGNLAFKISKMSTLKKSGNCWWSMTMNIGIVVSVWRANSSNRIYFLGRSSCHQGYRVLKVGLTGWISMGKIGNLKVICTSWILQTTIHQYKTAHLSKNQQIKSNLFYQLKIRYSNQLMKVNKLILIISSKQTQFRWMTIQKW